MKSPEPLSVTWRVREVRVRQLLISDVYKMPVALSLAVIVAILSVSVAASIWQARRRGGDHDADGTDGAATDPGAPDHPARPTPLEA